MTHERDDRNFAKVLPHAQTLEDVLAGRKLPSELSEEDQAILVLATELAKSDFSTAYGKRAALRHRLLNQREDARRKWSSIGDQFTMTTLKIRHLAWVVVVMVLVGILAFARFSPVMADSRQELGNWVAGSTHLPDGVRRAVIKLVGAPEVVIQDKNGTRQIHFNEVGSFERAQAAASFPLKQPAFLPEGYTLKSSTVSENRHWVILQYADEAGDVIQFDQFTAAPPEAPTGHSPETTSPARPAVQSANRGEGDPMVALNVVQWEADGVHYTLTGRLSEATLQAIADSAQLP